jgi:hypothetical protein
MRGLGLLAGLAAILAGLVLAGGEAILAERTAHANGAAVSQVGTFRARGFFAGAGLTSPL